MKGFIIWKLVLLMSFCQGKRYLVEIVAKNQAQGCNEYSNSLNNILQKARCHKEPQLRNEAPLLVKKVEHAKERPSPLFARVSPPTLPGSLKHSIRQELLIQKT